MRDAYLTGIIMRHLMQYLPSSENFKNVAKISFTSAEGAPQKCEAFLCRGECFNVTDSIAGDIGKIIKIFYKYFRLLVSEIYNNITITVPLTGSHLKY